VDKQVTSTPRRRSPHPSKRPADPSAIEAEIAAIVAFPAGAAVPDELPSSHAKDRISDVVKKAASGGRTTIISRGYPIAIIGPPEDIPEAARRSATRLPTTEIKSGQTSLKGIIARDDYAMLTIHGAPRAAVYRPQAVRGSAQTDGKLDRLIALLEETKLVEQRNQEALAAATRLEQVAAEIHTAIERSLALLETIDRDGARSLRARYAELGGRRP
jgi:antitoxin (DNA-binding transcriptional repressor) of toxin-antitoxin stability system